MDDWRGSIKDAKERSKHAATPKEEPRPFETAKRFDAMAGVEPLRIHDVRVPARSA
jgi:hypothetical protein